MKTKLEYLLECLAEECNEVAQRKSKLIRFGLTEKEPGQDLNNTERLKQEFLDLLAVYNMIEDEENTFKFRDVELSAAINKKKEKINKYYEYSKSLGLYE